MNGHLIENINSVLWADADLIGISMNYDVVNISINESTGYQKVIICEGYIGYKISGFWDDMTIKSGTIQDNHQFINECINDILFKYKNSPPPTGNPIRNKNNWYLLKVELIDNTEILVVCGNVTVSE